MFIASLVPRQAHQIGGGTGDIYNVVSLSFSFLALSGLNE